MPLCVIFVGFVGVSLSPYLDANPGGIASAPDTMRFDWHDSGLRIQENVYRTCFDSAHPNVLMVATEIGTVAYDWATGTRTWLNPRPFVSCGANGRLYAEGPSWLFSLDDPEGRSIEHVPTHLAVDGSAQVYWFQPSTPGTGTSKLLASSDGGLTWETRGDELRRPILKFAVASVDARVVYALVQGETEFGDSFEDGLTGQTVHTYRQSYLVYSSTDAGRKWRQRGAVYTFYDGFLRSELVYFATMPGRNSSVDLILAQTYQRGIHSNGGARNNTLLSGDGGEIFTCAICYNPMGLQPIFLYHSQEGLLRLNKGISYSGYANSKLEVSVDNGRHWFSLPLPPGHRDYNIRVNEDHPFIVYLTADSSRYMSFDGGHTWKRSDGGVDFLPYWPLRAYQFTGRGLLLADVPDAEKSLIGRVAPNYIPDGTYFLETGHNLWGEFKEYWEANQGLCRFGYPVSDPVPMISPVDGQLYTTQRFERVTLELHPANGLSPEHVERIAATVQPDQDCVDSEP